MSKQVSRRTFLATSGLAVATVGLGEFQLSAQGRVFAYVGRRTKGSGVGMGGGGGITVFRVSMSDGSLTEVSKTGADLDDLNSDGMCVSTDGRFLYSVIQTPSLAGRAGAGGGIAAFAINWEDGSLKHLNTQP
jgi:6-phosphogluconolactonase (cycloisomerase 2 family)